ncbi:DMT family transporter [Alcaligenes sp. 1735tsa3]|uniref:DMT family transporter n=1 Tax=Alcaligenes phenolicus TaxID=232846 RepID=A0ABV2BL64_9BURK|nr:MULTISPECIES: DMT family transporter [Alcaligenes]QRF89547.1 EamA family transporter [Alcaligenes faecalis]USY24721.1 DMT family transporter [Alcaligenes sp. 1735tsa3]SSY79289.1 Predicted permease, DMT superfamily [Alcaligenes faecalis subsp. faecalis]HBJ66995.1 EamA family transporter [Alcaligenes faecalis]
MPPATSPALLPRHLAIMLLLMLGSSFAANHIAAKVALDHGTGLIISVIFRSAAATLALSMLLIWRKQALYVPRQYLGWQLMLGGLITMQCMLIYSSIARIPVALALLVANMYPILLALLTWILGGHKPTRKTSIIMVAILIGLLLALDAPSLIKGATLDGQWVLGVVCSLLTALTFAIGLWITENKLAPLPGLVRSFCTISQTLVCLIALSPLGLLPGGSSLPHDAIGWIALSLVCVLYTTGFVTLFVLAPRLDMTRNAPFMNMEPVASLILGWLILKQTLNSTQLLGGAVVLSGIVALAYQRAPRK